jgi:hypothetical protein
VIETENFGNMYDANSNMLQTPFLPFAYRHPSLNPFCDVAKTPIGAPAPLGKNRKACVPNGKTDTFESPQTTARAIRWDLLKAVATLLPKSRTAICRRRMIPKRSHVAVYRSHDNGSTFYGGLQICGSVWSCPPCSSKISTKRAIEVKTMMDIWKSRGGKILMVTFTFPHHFGQRLHLLYKKFSAARRKQFFNSKTWRNWKKSIGFHHSIEALEVNEGENGWHIHLHFMIFYMLGSDTKEPLASDLLPAWQSACIAEGLGRPNEHGLVISDAEEAGSYISKWGMELELTKSCIKRGRDGNRTPWDLLRDFMETGNVRSGELFKEYANVFKGKEQLHCSRRLRKDLGLGSEKTDQQLVEENIQRAERLGSFRWDEWQLILKHCAEGWVLEIAKYGGWEAVEKFMDSLIRAG